MPKFIWTFLKLQKKRLTVYYMIVAFTAVIAIIRTFWFGKIIWNMQEALKMHDWNIFINWLIILVLIELLLFVIRVIQEFIQVKYRGYMNLLVRIFGVDHSVEMNYQNIAKLWSGKLLQIIHSGMESYSYLFYNFGNILIQSLIFFVVLAVLLIKQNIFFLFFFIISFVLVILAQKYWFKKLKEKRQNDVKLNEEYTKQTARILMNFVLLKIFGIKEKELEKLKQIGQKRIDNYVWIKFWFSNIARALNVILIIAMFGFVYYAWKMYISWKIDISQILFIFFLIAFARRYFFAFWLNVAELSEKLTYIQRYDEIVSEWKKQKKYIWLKLDNLNTNILFENLYFRYDGQESYLFEDFNLKINKWDKIAIIGRSWSWKSTLFKLLTKMVEPEKWKILFQNLNKKIPDPDFFDIKQLSYETIFKKVWLFWQDPLVFDGTIRENLTLNTNVDDEILEKTLQRVWLDYLRLNDIIWENWVLLSWWEKQRLALARIFLFDFDILLLDEPTANLDEELEKQVLDDIFQTYKNKTILIISHRPYVLDLVNRIITMKKWEIIQDKYK